MRKNVLHFSSKTTDIGQPKYFVISWEYLANSLATIAKSAKEWW